MNFVSGRERIEFLFCSHSLNCCCLASIILLDILDHFSLFLTLSMVIFLPNNQLRCRVDYVSRKDLIDDVPCRNELKMIGRSQTKLGACDVIKCESWESLNFSILFVFESQEVFFDEILLEFFPEMVKKKQLCSLLMIDVWKGNDSFLTYDY